MRSVCVEPLPKSWWSIYTEALCNSRGYQTDSQRLLALIHLQAEVNRDIERIAFRDMRFTRRSP